MLHRKAVALRRGIMVVALIGIVPVAVAAAYAELAFVLEAQRSNEAKTLEVTRIAASAIEVELRQSVSALNGLALSPLLDKKDFHSFGELLRRFVAKTPGWRGSHLAHPDGRVVLSTDGHPIPPPVYDYESFDRVAATRAPVIGPLLRRPEGWGIAVRVPVMRNGGLAYVLTAIQGPDAFQRIVDTQRLPGDWTMSVFDAANKRVARSVDPAIHLGGSPAPSLLRLMSAPALSGTGVTATLEGVRGHTAYVRLPESGWTVAVTIPTISVLAGAIKPAAVSLVGLAAAIVLALLAAHLASRRIADPIRILSEEASRIGEGQVPAPPATNIAEIAALGASLAGAAQTRRQIEVERAAVNEQRDLLLESERVARAEAVRSGHLKDQFLATLSHELRTPLNSILGWSQILKHPNATADDRQKGLDIIERNARTQARLIEDLLDVSRITSGKVSLDVQILQPAAALRQAIEMARPAAAAKRISIHEQLNISTGPIAADPARLQQIIGNLLSNAIKFTSAGGRIDLVLDAAPDHIEIRVADTGAGIDPEFLPSIFDRFRQADASTTRKHGGLGLGLSIVRDLVRMHQGSVWAESAGLGCGCAFIVRFPVATDGPIAWAPAPSVGPHALAGVRVVVVDDEEDARMLAARLLEDSGATVFAAASAEAALAAIERERPDVLVSDVSMPEHDGYQLIRRLRSLDGPFLPAIAVTAFARVEDREQALAAGFSAHLAKPVEAAVLVATVAKLASSRRSARAAA
jgi:signal transduction histidine kinase/CheY-like chemotaxis protein